jgi:histidinol-phosphate aminotransferase
MFLSDVPAACSGLSRRSFFRLATGASALAGLPFLTEADLALAQLPVFPDSGKGIHINANENPLGPSDAARQAVIDIVPRGGRYLLDKDRDLAETFAKLEGLSPDSVMPFPGSSQPLQLAVLAFTSKTKPLVIADPGYEAPIWASQASGAPVIKVPLADPKGAATHDMKAMVAASPNTGVIYICNPNNPTGTSTGKAEIEFVVANAPKGSILLIDEAYIHLSDAPSALEYVREGKDVIVLRTFSKLYGMAGLRAGFAVARPDLLKQIGTFAGLNALPITAVAAAKASLLDKDLVPVRKKLIGDVRRETLDWLKGQGYTTTPSETNCFMLDVRRPGKEVIAAMAAKEVYIGRVFPAWPTHVRITVGLSEEMLTFRKAFVEVMSSSTAGLAPPPLPRWLAEHPFAQLL